MNAFSSALLAHIKASGGKESIYALMAWKGAQWPHVSRDHVLVCIRRMVELKIAKWGDGEISIGEIYLTPEQIELLRVIRDNDVTVERSNRGDIALVNDARLNAEASASLLAVLDSLFADDLVDQNGNCMYLERVPLETRITHLLDRYTLADTARQVLRDCEGD